MPSLNEVIFIVMPEESRQGIMLEPQSIHGSSILANGANIRGSKSDQQTHKESWKTKLAKMVNGDLPDNL